MKIVALLGSPSASSRSLALVDAARTRLLAASRDFRSIALRELPPRALLLGDAGEPALRHAVAAVAAADLVVVATPIYKAAYSGLLKVFLDLLPADALRGKTVLPLATGGSASHLLAIEYALKPVLAALGARDVLDAVFATDAQLPASEAAGVPAADVLARLDQALRPCLGRVPALPVDAPPRRRTPVDTSEELP